MSARLLFIGLDAMSPALILRWARSGELPVLARLLDRGYSADVANPAGFLSSVSLWPTFFTATQPVAHGYMAYRQIVPGTYSTRIHGPDDVSGEPLWERLSKAGKRIAVIDIPWAQLSKDINGIHVNEWMTHDTYNGLETNPASLKDELLAKYGADVVGQCDNGGRGPGNYALFATQLDERIARRTRFARVTLSSDNWDLFMVGLSDAHCVGHQCWHLHDRDHPRFDPAFNAARGDPVKAVYQALDRSIGDLIDAAPGARVMVYSSHGMAACYDANPGLDDILRKFDDPVAGKPGLAARATPLLRRVIPARLHTPLMSLALKWKNRVARSDWPQRRFFPVPSSYGGCGCVRFNLVGREPQGRIKPGRHLEQVRAELESKLLTLRNADSGRPVVSRVLRTEALFDAPLPMDFPDLLVEWNDETPITQVVSERFNEKIEIPAGNRSGNHRPDGLLIVTGQGVHVERSVNPVDVTTLAPSIAAYLGVQGFGHGSPVPRIYR